VNTLSLTRLGAVFGNIAPTALLEDVLEEPLGDLPDCSARLPEGVQHNCNRRQERPGDANSDPAGEARNGVDVLREEKGEGDEQDEDDEQANGRERGESESLPESHGVELVVLSERVGDGGSLDAGDGTLLVAVTVLGGLLLDGLGGTSGTGVGSVDCASGFEVKVIRPLEKALSADILSRYMT